MRFLPPEHAALAGISAQAAVLGGQIVAISPQNAVQAGKLAPTDGASCPILCDMGLGVPTALGLTFVVDEVFQRDLSLLQVDLDAANSGDRGILPVTATFVFDNRGCIAARHVDPDPRLRRVPALRRPRDREVADIEN